MSYGLSDLWGDIRDAGGALYNAGGNDTGMFTGKDLANLGLGGYGLWQAQQSIDTADMLAAATMDANDQSLDYYYQNIAPQQTALIEQQMIGAGFDKQVGDDGTVNWSLSPRMQSNFNTMQGMQDTALGIQQQNVDYAQQINPSLLNINTQGIINAQQSANLQGAILASKTNDLSLYNQNRGLEQSFYDEAQNTPDRNAMAGSYAAGTINTLADAQKQNDIRMGMTGALPGSARSIAAQNASMADRALAIASAKNQGRTAADTIKFDKLGAAVNVRKGLAPSSLQTAGSALGINNPTVTMPTASLIGSAVPPDPTAAYGSLLSMAARAAGQNSAAGMQLIQRGLNP